MPKSKTYDQADVVRVAVEFVDTAGSYFDPATVSLIIQDAAGTTNTYTYSGAQVSRASLGNYYRDVDLTSGEPGWWYYRWVGTGSTGAAEEGQFFVKKAVNA
jgi:hypothetical protein